MEMRLAPLFGVSLLLEGDRISSVAARGRKRESEKKKGGPHQNFSRGKKEI